MKNNNYFLGYITNSKDLRIDFELNKTLYNVISKKYKKFFIINLYNLINNKNYLYNNKKLKYLPKNFEIFSPKSYAELDQFLKQKKFVLFISLGKGIKYLKTLNILKKRKVKIILNNNTNILGKDRDMKLEINKFKFLKILKYYFNKFYYILFRLSNLINLTPYIDIVFEANQKYINHFNSLFLKKIGKKININLSYYKELIRVNSRSYDDFISTKNNIENKYICFLDSGFDHGDRIRIEGHATEKQRKKYYNLLSKVLIKLRNIYKKNVIISVHPKTNVKIINKYLKEFKIVKFKTKQYISKSEIIVYHESSSFNWAIILKKKSLCLTHKETMGNYLHVLSQRFPKKLNTNCYDMDDFLKLSDYEINKIIKDSNKYYDKYIKNNLCMNYNNFEKTFFHKKKSNKNFESLPGNIQILYHLNKRFKLSQ